jgi:hypothetical protein
VKASRTRFGAFAVYLCNKFSLRCVRVCGGFVVERVSCETCRYKESNHTPLCAIPSSVGCDDWKIKEL